MLIKCAICGQIFETDSVKAIFEHVHGPLPITNVPIRPYNRELKEGKLPQIPKGLEEKEPKNWAIKIKEFFR